MKFKQLETIFESTPQLPYEQNQFRLREGFRVLFDLFEESDGLAADHEQIWYGSIEDILDKIKAEDAMYLAERGWFIDEGSFSHFTN